MKTTVFVTGRDHPGAEPGVLQPAYRAWSDAFLLRHEAAVGGSKLNALASRATARLSRIEPIGGYSLPISVDSSACLAAISSDRLRLYFPPVWSEDLLDYLGDRRFSPDLVGELVLPCAAPMVPVDVTKMADVFAETPSYLLDEIQAYFSNEISAYVDSLSLASDAGDLSEDWEILIPFTSEE
jgi:hypothetical protein